MLNHPHGEKDYNCKQISYHLYRRETAMDPGHCPVAPHMRQNAININSLIPLSQV